MKKGQLYSIKNSSIIGVIEKVDAPMVTLKRIVGEDGRPIPKNELKPIALPRSSVENSIETGHLIMISGGMNDPNVAFLMRKHENG